MSGSRGLLDFFDWPNDMIRTHLQEIFIHTILPVILFFLAFGVLVFSHLLVVVRLILVALMVLFGLCLGGWLHLGGLLKW